MRKNKTLRRRAYNTSDRALRWQIFRHLADPQVKGEYMVENMEAVFNWIKGGTAGAKAKGKGPKLAVVKGDAPRL